MKLGYLRWAKLIKRWSAFPDCPEKNLCVAVVAHAISDAEDSASEVGDPIVHPGWLTRGVSNWCTVIGLDPKFLRDQVAAAGEYLGGEKAGA